MGTVLSGTEFEPLAESVDREYAKRCVTPEREGTPVGPDDVPIDAHALSRGTVPATANRGEFSRVEGLALEDRLDADA